MANPLVSVVIPTYNRANTICSAIESTLGQTYKNIEVIVVNDGSTDDTHAKLAGYGKRIRVIKQNNVGPSAARNRGIKISTGEILTFLDSDDLWLPTKIEKQVDILRQVDKSVPCCLCNAIIRTSNGDEQLSFDLASVYPRYDEGVWMNATEILSTRCIFFTQAVAIRRETLQKVGGFNESLSVMEDHELALKLSLEGSWAYIQDPLVIYNRDTLGSLANQARQNPSLLLETVAKINSDFLSDNWSLCRKTQRCLQRRVREAQYLLHVKQMLQKVLFPEAQLLTRILYFLGHLQNAVFRRLSWFPKMQVRPLNRKNSQH
ncbi:glycosyltransferase [Candidatus Pacearchaeota archaeon]|nr:glycosyltransferase [Candidatus Pacearchaeota archaeon]